MSRNNRPILHASHLDPLRPEANLSDVQPYYEDRILVRWEPPLQRETHAGIVSPTRPSPRDEGPQQGIVVSVGPGMSGKNKLKAGDQGQPVNTFKSFKGGGRFETICKPGDRILYHREPDKEFIEDGQLFTFLFEEQRVLAVLEAA